MLPVLLLLLVALLIDRLLADPGTKTETMPDGLAGIAGLANTPEALEAVLPDPPEVTMFV